MTADELAERLTVLKHEDWPRFSVAHIEDDKPVWNIVRADPALTETVNRYLRHWVPGACPGCAYGCFSWGLVHGEGSCSCGWPGRLYHRIESDGVEVVRFDALLWAHPYEVSLRGAR